MKVFSRYQDFLTQIVSAKLDTEKVSKKMISCICSPRTVSITNLALTRNNLLIVQWPLLSKQTVQDWCWFYEPFQAFPFWRGTVHINHQFHISHIKSPWTIIPTSQIVGKYAISPISLMTQTPPFVVGCRWGLWNIAVHSLIS